MEKLIKQNFTILLLLVGSASLLGFGILGVGRISENSFDGAYLYAAGRSWLHGINPYEHSNLIQSVAGLKGIPKHNDYFLRDFFAYPPQSAALCIALALFNYPSAKIVLLLLNLLAIAVIVTITVHTISQYSRKNDHLSSGVMAALIIGNPYTTHVVWMGQSSLIAFAATMTAWVFSRQRKWILAGIFLGLASFKPQTCLLLIVWFLLERSWKMLSVALVTAVVLSTYPILVQGPIGMLKAWYTGLQDYKSAILNAVGTQNDVVGLDKLLHALSLPSSPIVSILGVALVLMLWIYRKNFNAEDILGILMGMTVTFIYAHNYDYVCLIPVFTSLCLYYHAHRKFRFGIIFLSFMLFLPQRSVRAFGISILEQWRTVVVLILLAAVVAFSITRKSTHRLWGDELL